MIGILGEYLWRNLEETRRRPRFVVDRVLEQHRRRLESRLTRVRGEMGLNISGVDFLPGRDHVWPGASISR